MNDLDNLDRRVNEHVSKTTRKVYMLASFMIALCLIYLKWGEKWIF